MRFKIICWFIFCLVSDLTLAQNTYQRIDGIPVFQNGIQLINPWAGGLNSPLFSQIDLNGDGKKDLFSFDLSGGRIECFINQGTPDSIDYKFSSGYTTAFPYLHDWVFLRDYNCDGKEDIFAFSDDFTGIKVYENISSGGNPQFKLVSPVLKMIENSQSVTIPSNSVIYPAIIDVDNDGDLDILNLSGTQPRSVVYIANQSEESHHNCDSLTFQFETACWGNFSLCSGTGSSNAVCNFNISCREGFYMPTEKIQYDPADAARLDDSFTNIFAFDENGDGAKDLLIGDIAATNSLLVINGGTPAAANMVSQDGSFPSYDIPINVPFANHSYVDVNYDNKSDLLVTSTGTDNFNSVMYYKNNGTTSAPVLSYQGNSFLQDQMIDVGAGCYPVFIDYNHDGKQDIVIGNAGYNPELNGHINTALALYENIGNDTSPAFELIDPDFAGLSGFNFTGPIYPAFGDLNGDGKADLIIGDGNGSLTYFINAALANQPDSFIFSSANYMGIHAGQSASPQLIDLNRDGLLDLVIGSRIGYLKYYQNIGTASAANFSSTVTIDSLGNANTAFSTSGYSVPFIYDDNGQYKMFLAGEKGNVLHYDNIDNNLNGTFNLTDTIIKGSEGTRLSVSGADLNNDGKIDLIVGNYAGGAGIFSQNLIAAVKSFTTAKPAFELTPNPANNLLAVHVYNLNKANAWLDIIDMMGRTVKRAVVSSTTLNFNIADLSSGIYIVDLQSEKFLISRKLIIQH